MSIVTYRTELDDMQHNILVKEQSIGYAVERFNQPKQIAEMLIDVFRINKQAEEYLYMLALNADGMILGAFELSHGTVNYTVCNPRDIFIKALLCGAVNIVLAHNHPSGNTSPSKADMEAYKRVSEAGELIGIDLIDNIIVGKDGYYSFKEHEIL